MQRLNLLLDKDKPREARLVSLIDEEMKASFEQGLTRKETLLNILERAYGIEEK